MKLKFLGTGTSQGVPIIGCHCPVCKSNNLKDRRFRSSAMITTDLGKKILIDCGPDFRQQMILNNEEMVDAILITHEHNDHIIGLDDIRPIIFITRNDMPVYCSERVGTEIRSRFPYAFADDKYPGAPSFQMNIIENKLINICGTDIEPIEVIHGKINIFGYRFGNLAYITDASQIIDAEKQKLMNLEILVVNCLRKTATHPSHFILLEVLKLYEELNPKQLYLTHLSHDFGLHEREEPGLPHGIRMAYDGLEIFF